MPSLQNSICSLCPFLQFSETLETGQQFKSRALWVDLTAFLWLSMMTVTMGALEVVFDVFVLLRAGFRSPLHALMSWCAVWCWPSNLLWCSGPGVHPSILPFCFLHSNTGRHSLIYIGSRKRVAPHSAWCWRWDETRLCVYTYKLCVKSVKLLLNKKRMCWFIFSSRFCYP